MNSHNYILTCNNLRKIYKNQTEALRGANLEIKRGEVLSIMGPSGSGKSTLLHCLSGIIAPTSGSIIYNNNEISKLSDSARHKIRRENFGFVFQFSQLVPELTVLDNVALPLLIKGSKKQLAYQRAEVCLERIGISKIRNSIPGEISGGQAQRVAIARSIVANPDIIFADEPTGSLDSINSEKVMNILIDMVKANGTTLIIVTHESTIAAYADRTIVVRDGKVYGN